MEVWLQGESERREPARARSSDVVLSTPTAPELIAPQAGFTDVHQGTRFSWRRMSGAIYLLAIRYNGTETIFSQPPNYYVFTADTTATVADMSEFGFSYFRGASYVWEVRAWAPIGKVDDIAVATWFVPQGDMQSAASAPRSST